MHNPISTLGDALDEQACYQAFAHKDVAWDGLFVMGVSSTRIYCRPVCRVRLPRQENCQFFRHPAQAEAAGFRPCLRCRPELAPSQRWWSLTDATSILAEQASDRIKQALHRQGPLPNISTLARELGISDRHLRRIFLQHWGVSPLQYQQTLRLLAAKALLQDTQRPVQDIALACGFGSPRALREAFARHYRMSPTDLRKKA